MRLNLFRREQNQDSKTGLNVLIISASCCVPGMQAFDDQAMHIVQQAIVETGVEAKVNLMPGTTAYFGGAPKEVMAKLISMSQSGKLGVPAILVNGKAVSFGVPTLELMKEVLTKSETEATK